MDREKTTKMQQGLFNRMFRLGTAGSGILSSPFASLRANRGSPHTENPEHGARKRDRINRMDRMGKGNTRGWLDSGNPVNPVHPVFPLPRPFASFASFAANLLPSPPSAAAAFQDWRDLAGDVCYLAFFQRKEPWLICGLR